MNMRQILTQRPAGWRATCGRNLRPWAPAKVLQADAPSRVEDYLFQFSTSTEKGTCSSSYFRASVAFAGSRSVNSYVSHSWYSLLAGFVLTRSASSFGSYQKLPQLLASFEKMTVHSS